MSLKYIKLLVVIHLFYHFEQVHRMEIVKPFGVAQLVRDHVVTNDKMIHFILPVSSSVSERFQDFLKSFEDICLQTLGIMPVLTLELNMDMSSNTVVIFRRPNG